MIEESSTDYSKIIENRFSFDKNKYNFFSLNASALVNNKKNKESY